MHNVTTIIKQINLDETIDRLVSQFAQTAVERDRKGGNAKTERDLLRESGLLSLLIPSEQGGLGGNWHDVFKVVQSIARVDSSLAHIYGYHCINLVTPHLCGTEEQWTSFYRQTAQHQLFWGNAFNPVDIKLEAVKQHQHFVLNGVKTFCSGSVDSDVLLVSAHYEAQEDPLLAVIPTNRIGIDVKEDWDNMGQRQTDSGTVIFENVIVKEEEVLQLGFNHSNFSRLRYNIATFVLNHVYLGIAEGAFAAALDYTKTTARPRFPQYVSALEDPVIQHHYGEFHVQLEAARLIVERADQLLQQLWDTPSTITEQQLQALDNALQTAKVFTTKTGLQITSDIFEVMSSRSTAARYGFDRYWRNIRTMTLHVPVDVAIQTIGQKILVAEQEDAHGSTRT